MCWRARRRSSLTSLTNDFGLVVSNGFGLSLGTASSFRRHHQLLQPRCQARGALAHNGGAAAHFEYCHEPAGITWHFLLAEPHRHHRGPIETQHGNGMQLATGKSGRTSKKGGTSMNQDIIS